MIIVILTSAFLYYIYNIGYNHGLEKGYEDGFVEGEIIGNAEGYKKGYEDGKEYGVENALQILANDNGFFSQIPNSKKLWTNNIAGFFLIILLFFYIVKNLFICHANIMDLPRGGRFKVYFIQNWQWIIRKLIVITISLIFFNLIFSNILILKVFFNPGHWIWVVVSAIGVGLGNFLFVKGYPKFLSYTEKQFFFIQLSLCVFLVVAATLQIQFWKSDGFAEDILLGNQLCIGALGGFAMAKVLNIGNSPKGPGGYILKDLMRDYNVIKNDNLLE